MDLLPFILFNLFVICMLALDLGVLNRKARVIGPKEALSWSGFWIFLSLTFCLWLWISQGEESAYTFLTAYLIEKALSVDNVFVFFLIFAYFKIASKDQHRILFHGIIAALIMRAILIGAGLALVNAFNWMLYFFAVILIFLGIKMFLKKKAVHFEKSRFLLIAKKFLPFTSQEPKGKFCLRERGRLFGTKLLMTLILIEGSDLLFSLDSIPAVFTITSDPTIVYTSNILALLGLRSLFFAFIHLASYFTFLPYALGAILIFIGLKVLVHDFYVIPVTLSLSIIAGLIGISILARYATLRSRS